MAKEGRNITVAINISDQDVVFRIWRWESSSRKGGENH